MNIKRILIANRGEIALRIIRSCKALGIESILAASDADMNSMPAKLADAVINIGPPPSAASYLNVQNIIKAARISKADAIHPGYGFLSESTRLAFACINAKIIFIGPTVQQLQAIGDKLLARNNAVKAGLPVVPGAEVNDKDSALAAAAKIGTPLLIKAVAGGGGKGMKLVNIPSTLERDLDLASAEADAAFGDARLYLERYISNGRHIEVQLLGDGDQVIHLGTRDCSVQRRYQKLIEEAPAPSLPDDLREQIHQAAVRFATHLKYQGAGTVEFLVDVKNRVFYFLEMNARIQVEHPVTEAICGIDLIAEQIHIAEGKPLRHCQDDIQFHGHAIECRINAENPERDFQPVPGDVTAYLLPAGQGIRVDTHLQRGDSVPPFYDSLMAKLIVHGENRTAALHILQQALANTHIEGLPSNLRLHRELCQSAEFAAGGVDTAFFNRFRSRQTAPSGGQHG